MLRLSTLIKLFAVFGLVFLAACAKKEAAPETSAQPPQAPVTEAAPSEPVEVTPEITPGTMDDLMDKVGTDRVFFDFDKYDLSADARATLRKEADWLAMYDSITITVEGHCDERGTREYNLALGERRATAVKNYLVALGISPSRITTVSYGKERPAVLGSNEEAWAKNRRAVTVIN